MTDAHKIFISYAREDRRLAEKLRTGLKKSGVTVWSDALLVPGSRWEDKLKEKLRESSVLAVVLTRSAIESDWVQYECELALDQQATVVPMLYEQVPLPEVLAPIQASDCTRAKKPWLRLLDALAALDRESPRLVASFFLDHGKPKKVGSEYQFYLWVEGLASTSGEVKYHLHDKERAKELRKWSRHNSAKKFRTWSQSYGDFVISAKIRQGSTNTRIEQTLYQALFTRHRRSKNEKVQRALRKIRNN